MNDFHANRVQTVAEVTRSIRGLLESAFPFVTVAGEVSNLRRPYSGHLYFTLKDREAQLKAVLFKAQQRYLDGELAEGREVVCRGRISVYEPRGDYQLIVDVVDARGAGALQAAFEELKERLAAEGLFDPARKRPLPFLPRRVAVITSPSGAALFDFLKIAGHRFAAVPITVVPVRVQGEGAATEMVEALRRVNAAALADAIVLCRGGGSLEDLWPFNDERLARAIHASAIPVVSAVGHEVDFTIADFVADHRAPTPTAAAEAVLPDRAALVRWLAERAGRLSRAMARHLQRCRHQVDLERRALADPSLLLANFLLRFNQHQGAMHHAMRERLRAAGACHAGLSLRLAEQSPGRRLALSRSEVGELGRRLAMLIRHHLERHGGRLERAAGLLDAVSPLAVLFRGYAVARREEDGRVIRESTAVAPGDRVAILLHRGRLNCRVEETLDP